MTSLSAICSLAYLAYFAVRYCLGALEEAREEAGAMEEGWNILCTMYALFNVYDAGSVADFIICKLKARTR